MVRSYLALEGVQAPATHSATFCWRGHHRLLCLAAVSSFDLLMECVAGVTPLVSHAYQCSVVSCSVLHHLWLSRMCIPAWDSQVTTLYGDTEALFTGES